MPPPRSHDVMMKQANERLGKVNNYVGVGMDTCGVIVSDIIETYKEESLKQGEEMLTEVNEAMLEFCEMDRDLKAFIKSLHLVEQEVEELDEDDPVDLEDLLEKKWHEEKEKSKKTEVTQRRKYIEFRENVQELLNNAEGASPPDSDSADVEVEDEDLEMTEAEINTKCPITGKEMVNPVKNTQCGHKYDRDGILNHIKQRKGKAKCPIGGCHNPNYLQEEHLQEDRELKKYIQRKGRKGGRKGKKT